MYTAANVGHTLAGSVTDVPYSTATGKSMASTRKSGRALLLIGTICLCETMTDRFRLPTEWGQYSLRPHIGE